MRLSKPHGFWKPLFYSLCSAKRVYSSLEFYAESK